MLEIDQIGNVIYILKIVQDFFHILVPVLLFVCDPYSCMDTKVSMWILMPMESWFVRLASWFACENPVITVRMLQSEMQAGSSTMSYIIST